MKRATKGSLLRWSLSAGYSPNPQTIGSLSHQMGSYRIILIEIAGSLSYQMGSYRIILIEAVGWLSYQMGSYR
ncbi:MAG TPA: hypothetical protein VHS96_13140, partial [Bacteroidia bacterium]|nr:hypothetical protein [Bacteroidia bacterium]